MFTTEGRKMRTLKQIILATCLIPLAMAATGTNPEALSAVIKGTNTFSANLFKAVADEHPGNLIMCPYSAAVVLGMAAYGAAGQTEKQLKDVLHIPSPDTLGASGYRELITALNNVKENEILLANKAFVNSHFALKPKFETLTQTEFLSTTESVNFGQNVQAAGLINTWVKEKTKNRISDLVTPSDLSSDTALVLVNAVYFKGLWKNKFESALTKKMPFHINDKVVKDVSTMAILANYKYGELPEMNAKFIELPYVGDTVSMVIILPNSINGLAEVEQKLQSTNLTDILSRGSEEKVQLFLPKFKIESMIDLNSPLQKIGLTDMFTDHANFSGISDAPVSVSKVVQKAFIEVNEEGSEAAAATALIVSYMSSVETSTPILVEINRPFFYAIHHKSQNAQGRGDSSILFCGHITNPTT